MWFGHRWHRCEQGLPIPKFRLPLGIWCPGLIQCCLGPHKCPCQMTISFHKTALLGCLSLTAVSSFKCVCISVCHRMYCMVGCTQTVCVHPTVQYILPQRSKLLHLAAVCTCYGITDGNLLRLIAYTLYGGLCRRLGEISMLLSKWARTVPFGIEQL